jgi:hypothetical protein
MFQDDIPIPYKDLFIGMEVKNKDGDVGVIKEIIDSHNVFVEYNNGGFGLHCTETNCNESDIYYDPLFNP